MQYISDFPGGKMLGRIMFSLKQPLKGNTFYRGILWTIVLELKGMITLPFVAMQIFGQLQIL